MAKSNSIELAGEIVTSFVSNNSVPRGDLPALIEAVHAAVKSLSDRRDVGAVAVDPPEPAVSIRKSVTPDYLICLEDGKKFKSLRRHLTTLGMTPEQYREKWNLPSTYPMVAPNYAAQRSALAKNIGLGQSRGRHSAAAPEPAEDLEPEAETFEPAGFAESEPVDFAPRSVAAVEEAGAEPADLVDNDDAPPPASAEPRDEGVPEPTSEPEIEAKAAEPSSAPRRKPKSKAKTEAAEAPPSDAGERKRGRPRKTPT